MSENQTAELQLDPVFHDLVGPMVTPDQNVSKQRALVGLLEPNTPLKAHRVLRHSPSAIRDM